MPFTPLTNRIFNKIKSAIGWKLSESQETEQSSETLETEKSEQTSEISEIPEIEKSGFDYCPQAVSQLKAYKKQHQDLKQKFSNFISQVPFLPDVKWDEPFMSSPYYKDITNAPKNIFNNIYDAKEEARKKLEELKELSGYNEKEFSKLTQEQKIDYLYSRCFKPTQDPNQEPQYQQPIPDLRNYELRFLYWMDDAGSWVYHAKSFHGLKKARAIIINRQTRKADLAQAYACSQDQIITQHVYKLEDLSKDSVYCGNSMFLDSLKSAEGLELPQYVAGEIELGGLISADGLKFPRYVGGDFWLTDLQSANNTTFPEYVGGHLSLRSLKSAKGLKLPKHIRGDLDLGSLQSVEGLELPKSLDGDLNLCSLRTAKGLRCPEYVGGLNLDNLVSAKGLQLPKHIGKEGLSLRNLKTLEGFELPQHIDGEITISSDQRILLYEKYPNLSRDYKVKW